MPGTRWWTVKNRLVDRMRATTGFRSPGEDGDEDLALLYDGREWQMTGDYSPAYLVIGGSIERDDDGTLGQDWGPIGGRARDEGGRIVCNAIAERGDIVFDDEGLATNVPQDTWRTLGATCEAIVNALEANIRSDPALGFTSADGFPYLTTQIDGVEPRSYFTPTGAVVSAVVVVTYSTRI